MRLPVFAVLIPPVPAVVLIALDVVPALIAVVLEIVEVVLTLLAPVVPRIMPVIDPILPALPSVVGPVAPIRPILGTARKLGGTFAPQARPSRRQGRGTVGNRAPERPARRTPGGDPEKITEVARARSLGGQGSRTRAGS